VRRTIAACCGLLALVSSLTGVRAGEPGRSFDIPGTMAAAALKQFSFQSGQQVLYSSDDVAGVATNPVRGNFTVQGALDRMLAGTPLVATHDATSGAVAVGRREGPPRTTAIRRARDGVPPPLLPLADGPVELSPFLVQSIRDKGYVAADTLVGSRLSTPLVDTPAAIDVMTAEFLDDMGAITLEEALGYSVNADNDRGIDSGDNEQFEFASGRINVRGLRATRTRNFIPIPYSADMYNIDRVEEQRGPNSILFGIGSPAGVINVNTKRALLGHSSRQVQAVVSSAGGYRGTMDLNLPLHPRLAVRLNAVYSDLNDRMAHFTYRETRATTLAASWKPAEKVRFRGEVEMGRIESVESRNYTLADRVSRWLEAPVPRYTFSNWQEPGVALRDYGISSLGTANRLTYVDNTRTLVDFRNLHTTSGNGVALFEENFPELWNRRVNEGGPGQLRDNRFFSAGGALEVELTRKTHVEFAVNHSRTDTTAYMFNETGLRGSPNQFLSDNITPNVGAGRLYLEGQWRRWRKSDEYSSYRSTLSQELDLGKPGRYRIALMYEMDDQFYSNVQQREVWIGAGGMGLFHSSPTHSSNAAYRRLYILQEGNWADYHVSSPAFGLIDGMQLDTGQTASSAWRNANAGQTNENRYTTLLGALQSRHFADRLVVGIGYRYDRLKQRQFAVRDENSAFFLNQFNEQVTNPDRWSDIFYTGKTRTLGAVFHVNPNLRLMYNRSDNFGVPSSSRNRYPDNGPADNTLGEGYDIGVGFRFWSNRVSGRIARFATDSKNIYRAGYNLTNINGNLLNALVAHQAITGISQAQADRMYIGGTGGTVDQHVEGYEFSLVVNLTQNWRLRASYSYTDGYQTNSYPDQREYLEGDPNRRLGGFGGLTFFDRPEWAHLPLVGETSGNTIGAYLQEFKEAMAEEFAVDGVALARNLPHKASAFTSYRFAEGRLKGFRIMLGVRYQSAAQLGIGYDALGAPFALTGSESWIASGGVGYDVRAPWKLGRMRLQLNVDNLFDFSDYIVTARKPGDGSITRVTYERPRTSRLTASLSF
jgi:iron complex outermembrane recepter protein